MPWILEIRIKIRQGARHEHALVADRDRRQAGNECGGIAVSESLLGTAPCQKQLPVEGSPLHTGSRIDENLFDARQRLQGLLAADRRLDRHLAPAGDFQSRFPDGIGDRVARQRSNMCLPVHEHHADGKTLCKIETQFTGLDTKEFIGLLHEQATAIARLAIGGDCATMREPGQRCDRGFDNPVAGLVIETCNQTEPTAVVFESRIVETVCRYSAHAAPVRVMDTRPNGIHQ